MLALALEYQRELLQSEETKDRKLRTIRRERRVRAERPKVQRKRKALVPLALLTVTGIPCWILLTAHPWGVIVGHVLTFIAAATILYLLTFIAAATLLHLLTRKSDD